MNDAPSWGRYASDRQAKAFTTILVVLSLAGFEGSAFAQENQNDAKTALQALGQHTLALLDAANPKDEEIEDAGTTTSGLLSALPDSIDFGDLEVGFNTTRMLTLSNDSEAAVEGSVSLLPPFTITDGDEIALEPGGVHELTISFAPRTRGTFVQFLSFDANRAIELEVKIDARGVAPVLFADPPLLDFRVVQQGQSRVQLLRIANTGELLLDGEARVLPPFFLPEDAGRYRLGEGESTLLPIEFRPADAGVLDTTIQLTGSQSATVEIHAQSAANIGQFRGQIVDLLTGLPVVCAAIRIQNASGFETIVTSDTSGVFISEEIPQSSYDLTVYAPGYDQPIFSLDLSQGLLERRFELQPLAEEGSLRGVLGDAFSGALLGGIKVTVLQAGEQVAITYTCAKGSFEFRILDRNQPIVLAFAAPGYDTDALDTLVDPPFDRTLNFILMPEGAAAAEIFGTVTDRGTGDRLPMAAITATRLGIARTIFSGNDGNFDLSNIASGHYRIRVSAAAHLAEQDLEVTVFGADPPEALEVDLVAGLDEVDAPPATGDPPPTGCSAAPAQDATVPGDLALLLFVVAFFLPRARRTKP